MHWHHVNEHGPRDFRLREQDLDFSPNVITGPPHGANTPEYPAWMEGGAPASGKPIPGQTQLFHPNETLPLWTKVATGFSLMGMLYGLDHWARPTLRASKLQQRGGTWGWLQRVLDSIQAFLDHGTNYVGHEVSKGAAHSAHGPAHTISLGALRWEQLTWHLAYFVHEMELVTARLVHHVIPHAINQRVAPVITRVRRIETTVKRHGKQITVIRTYVTHEITRVIKPQITRIERTVTKTLPARIQRVERTETRTRVQVKQQQKWIIKLLPLLTIAGATALVLKAFGRLGLNFLRCQNVKGFGNELCPSPPGSGRGLGRFGGRFGSLLGDLAALSFVPFLLTDACRIVGLIEAVAIKVQPEIDALVLGIEGFVCGGTANLPSAIEASDLKRAAPLPSGL